MIEALYLKIAIAIFFAVYLNLAKGVYSDNSAEDLGLFLCLGILVCVLWFLLVTLLWGGLEYIMHEEVERQGYRTVSPEMSNIVGKPPISISSDHEKNLVYEMIDDDGLAFQIPYKNTKFEEYEGEQILIEYTKVYDVCSKFLFMPWDHEHEHHKFNKNHTVKVPKNIKLPFDVEQLNQKILSKD